MADKVKEEPKATDGPSKDDFEKMKAALAKANDEAKKYRLAAKAKDDELSALKSDQDSSKSEMDKIQDQLAELTKRAEKAEREAMVKDVVMSKKLPVALSGRLAGDTLEELEADATALIEALGLGDNEDPTDEDEPANPFTRPTENLRPGASSSEDEAPDYDKIADRIVARNKI